MTPSELATRWREDAELLDRYASTLADVCRRHADELDAALRAVADDPLDLETAARESGYSPDRLRHLVAAKQIPNAGRKGAPRIRRGDLPVKPHVRGGVFDAATTARDLLRGSDHQ